ncbi:MAG: glyoxylate/hydroxypyruvate reductase A, partial [Caldilineaceae bacterium]|nr:glyoxylate/hydroxypyruvate reductase A [Caldilineaceae bacterium]MCB0145252.1 glyoxylate/hydroxypyruvate reductase A [Caldilineaceae bacterium]
GGIIDEPTLIDMLQSGKLAGAGLDVTSIEPLPADNPLWDAPNIIITPHCSPTSGQTRSNVTNMMKTNLRHYLAGEPLENMVDKKLGY